MIDLYFILDEAFSLFPGGENGPRFGGAGLQLYLAATELSKFEGYEVSWIFRHSVALLDLESISHDSIKILDYHDQESMRKIAQSDSKKVLISSGGVNASLVRECSDMLGARSILRLSSDTDSTSPRDIGKLTKGEVFELYSSMDAVIVQSEFQKKNLRQNTGINAQVIKNYWPIVQPSENIVKDEILWVASAQPLKQPWYFLDLAQSLPQEKFVMLMPETCCGDTVDFIKAQAQKIENLALFPLQIPLGLIDLFFLRAKLFVNTSETEGFPNTFLQAGAAATPIATLLVDPDGVVSSRDLGISSHGDILSFREGVKTLLQNQKALERCGRNALEYVKGEHGVNSTIAKLAKIIDEVCR